MLFRSAKSTLAAAKAKSTRVLKSKPMPEAPLEVSVPPPPEAFGPPTPGPLQVYTPTGRLVISNGKTVIECLADLSTKVGEVVTMTVPLTKADCSEFTKKYVHNRPLSIATMQKLTRRWNTGDYIQNSPTLGWDSAGVICNGGHTAGAFIPADPVSWSFVVTLGIDPRMGPRGDTNKGRDLIDQCYYVDSMDRFKGIGIKKKDQRSFTSSVAYVFSMMVSTECLEDTALRPHEAKKEVVQHPLGQQLLKRCIIPYVQVRNMLELVAEEQQSKSYLLYKRVVFYVPALILYLAGYTDWPEKIAVGDLPKAHPLFKAHDYLATRAKESEDGSEKALRREQTEMTLSMYTLLAYAYAADTNPTAKVRLPLPHWDTKDDVEGNPQELDVWKHYSKQQKADDTKFKLAVAEHFLSKIKLG